MPPKYSAVIIEPREHRALEFVLRNFCANLSDEWGIVFFHGSTNLPYIVDIINNKLPQYKDRFVKFVNIGVPNLNLKEHTRFCMSVEFYEQIPTETFLTFQTDTYINPKRKDYINDFLDYDYVGAPWAHKQVGNGGLSLRKRSTMINLIRSYPWDGCNEDCFFSNLLSNPEVCAKHNYKIPTFDEAKRFAIETVYSPVFFGIHAAWKHMYPQLMNAIVRECPEIIQLIQLNRQ